MKDYLYILKSEGYGQILLKNAPAGWDSQKVSIKRSPTYKGLFREFSTSLQFVKDGQDYLQRIYEEKGTEHDVYIGIYQYQPSPIDKFYLYFAGMIDLSTYKYSENYVEVDVNESNIAKKLMSRDDVKVNLSGNKSIEGVSISPDAKKDIILHERKLLQTAKFVVNELANPITTSMSSVESLHYGFVLPIQIESNDIENVQAPTTIAIDEAGCNFWQPITNTSQCRVYGNIKGKVVDPVGGSTQRNYYIYFRYYDDETLTTYANDGPLWQWFGNITLKPEIDVTFDRTLLNINPGNVLALIFECEAVSVVVTVDFEEINLNLEIQELRDPTTTKCHLIYESAKNIIETICDKQNILKSEYLGRVANGYLNDGEASKRALLSGKMVRSFPNESVSISLQEFFKSIHAIDNIGIGIEYDKTSNPYVRIEHINHFFNGNVIMTIDGVSDIQKSVAREWIYNSIEVGYDKAEYEEVNGIEEFNNKFEWATPIKTIKNKLDLVSKIRADGYGLEFARRKQYKDTPTEDTKYDNDNFIIDIKEQGGYYVATRNEDYDFVQNIFDPDSAYNLNLSPGRMIRKHGGTIRAGIEKNLQPIKFQFAAQKSNMQSQVTGEAEIIENQDIDSNTLTPGLWIPEIYSFKSMITREQLAAISKNPGGIVKFGISGGRYYYGWILSIESEENKASWELLRVNTKSPDVVLIDPTGQPGTPQIPTEPADIFGVFDGSFDLILVS